MGKEAVSAPAHGPEVNPFSFYPSQRLNGARRSDLSVTNELEIKAEAQLLVLAALLAAGLDRVRGYARIRAPRLQRKLGEMWRYISARYMANNVLAKRKPEAARPGTGATPARP